MNNLVDRVYVHAKIQALHGYLLSKEDYREIARSGKIDAAFPGDLSGIKPADLIRIKEGVFRRQAGTFILLMGLNDYYRELFRSFLLLFELNNIKYLLQRTYGRTPLVPQWYDVSPCNLIDVEARNTVTGIDELRSLLGGTVFSEAFEFEDPPSCEMLESKLEFLALKNQARYSVRLHPSDRSVYNDILVRKSVAMKMLWDRRRDMYREPFFPQFSLMDIFDGSAVTGSEIEAVEKDMRVRIDREFASSGASGDSIDIRELEQFLDRLFISHVKKIFSKDFHGIRPVLSYAWLLYYQIRNLFMIIEGFYFNVGPDAILGRLVGGE